MMNTAMNTARRPDSILSLAPLDEGEHPDVFIRALELLHEEGITFKAVMVGDPTDPDSVFAHKVRNKASTLALEGVLSMRDGVPDTQAPELFDDHAIVVNLSPSGVSHLVLQEAARAGTLIVASDEKLRGVLPDILLVNHDSRESVAAGIKAALGMSAQDRSDVVTRLQPNR